MMLKLMHGFSNGIGVSKMLPSENDILVRHMKSDDILIITYISWIIFNLHGLI
jgi:hypothetical protein